MEKKYDYKNHWDNAYNNNSINELGWYEDDPKASFDLIEKCKISNDSIVFHAGAGSSLLIGLLFCLFIFSCKTSKYGILAQIKYAHRVMHPCKDFLISRCTTYCSSTRFLFSFNFFG